MVSIDSSKVISGKIVGSRFASMLLPAPGGPISRILCPPAAATSRAFFAANCPLTSLKSTASERAGAFISVTGMGVKVSVPVRWAISCFILLIPYTFIPSIIAASAAFSSGTKTFFMPLLSAVMVMARTPPTGLNLPSSETSPIKTLSPISASS